MHPLIDEFCRANDFRPTFLRRCQREFRTVVQPLLDERDTLIVENAALKAENDALKTPAKPAPRKRVEAEAAC